MFETVSERGTSFSRVCDPGNEQRERFGVAGNTEWPYVDRIESDIVDQSRDHLLGREMIPAKYQARARLFPARFEHIEENLTGNGMKSLRDVSPGELFREFLRA